MPVPNTFGTATSAIPLSQLDANFAAPITLGNTAIQLGNTVTTLNNMTLANVTISSGNVTITNVAITTANVSGTANISTLVVVGNATVGGNTTITGNITAANANVTTNLVLSNGTANGVAYLNTNKVLTTGSALTFDGTTLAVTGSLNATKSGGTLSTLTQTSATGYGLIIIPGADTVYDAFTINNAANTLNKIRMFGDGSATFAGNVGIGTSSPTAFKLDVSGNIRGLINNASVGNATSVQLTQNGAGDAAISFLIGSTTEWLAGVDNSDSDSFKINAITGGGDFNGTGITIDTSGNLGIGTTSTGHKIEILQTATSGTAIKSVANNASFADIICEIQAARNTTNGSFTALRYYNSGAAETKFEVLDSGTVNNRTGVYGNLSDAKLKENIVDATSKLEKINQLKVRNFNFIGDSLKQIGFVAQEFEQVFPAMVQENSDIDGDGNNLGTTTKSIKTTVLIPILVKAIQEQQAIITQLTARITALEGA